MSNESDQQNRVFNGNHLEGMKLFYDTMKHLTTLSTGSVLVLVAMLEKVFPNAAHKWPIAPIFILFMLSTLCALFSMHFIAMSTGNPKDTNDTERDIAATVVAAASLFFLLGIVVVMIFASINA